MQSTHFKHRGSRSDLVHLVLLSVKHDITVLLHLLNHRENERTTVVSHGRRRELLDHCDNQHVVARYVVGVPKWGQGWGVGVREASGRVEDETTTNEHGTTKQRTFERGSISSYETPSSPRPL